ncbi:hypothetical protein AB1N83_006876 [Pleurotus pulmonarius]
MLTNEGVYYTTRLPYHREADSEQFDNAGNFATILLNVYQRRMLIKSASAVKFPHQSIAKRSLNLDVTTDSNVLS